LWPVGEDVAVDTYRSTTVEDAIGLFDEGRSC
jgi:hypothetical protein